MRCLRHSSILQKLLRCTEATHLNHAERVKESRRMPSKIAKYWFSDTFKTPTFEDNQCIFENMWRPKLLFFCIIVIIHGFSLALPSLEGVLKELSDHDLSSKLISDNEFRLSAHCLPCKTTIKFSTDAGQNAWLIKRHTESQFHKNRCGWYFKDDYSLSYTTHKGK